MELNNAESFSSENKTYSEIFDEQFPFYLSLGMTAAEYWEGDLTLPLFYRKAYKLKKDQENDHENTLAWLQGQYIAEAISSCFSKSHRYPKEPYKLKAEKEPKTKADIQKKLKSAVSSFTAFVEAKNAERRRKLSNSDKNSAKTEKFSAKQE